MAFETLLADVKESGLNQGDLVKLLNNIVRAVNELVDDHATMRTEVVAIGATLASVKSIYDAHTHEVQGSSATAGRSSTPDTGSAENSLTASAASAVTDTSGSSVPAVLTANDTIVLTG